jgi:hypothetical protein
MKHILAAIASAACLVGLLSASGGMVADSPPIEDSPPYQSSLANAYGLDDMYKGHWALAFTNKMTSPTTYFSVARAVQGSTVWGEFEAISLEAGAGVYTYTAGLGPGGPVALVLTCPAELNFPVGASVELTATVSGPVCEPLLSGNCWLRGSVVAIGEQACQP